jgi:hypothetical protein
MELMSDKIGMKTVWSDRNIIELDLCRSFMSFSISHHRCPEFTLLLQHE